MSPQDTLGAFRVKGTGVNFFRLSNVPLVKFFSQKPIGTPIPFPASAQFYKLPGKDKAELVAYR